MKRFIFFIFLFLLLFFPQKTFAQEDWGINSFDADVTVQADGRVKVVENIDVSFNIQKHGIYRDIPYQYVFENGQKEYIEIVLLGVSQDDTFTRYKTSNNNGYLEIKIGDANKTITGFHTYTIMYLVIGALRGFDTNDELFWNVTGDKWDVPIEKARATVHLPRDDLLESVCFEGVYGSTTGCQLNEFDKKTVSFQTTQALTPGEGLTVAVAFTKGMVPLLVAKPPATFIDRLKTPQNLFGLIIPILAIALFIPWLWWRKGRDPKEGHETIVVEFVPPEKLRPAELGVLMDERADTLDVTATIVDLAVRGYLTIKEEPKKWLFGNIDYILNKTEKDHKGLLPYEEELLTRIFEQGNSVSVSNLKTKFYEDLKLVKKLLYINVVAKNLFPQDPQRIRNIYTFVGFLVAFAGISIMAIGFQFEGNVLFMNAVGLGVLMGGGMIILLARAMSRRTVYGHELYRRAKGYELFIGSAEKYRQQFFEKENMFNEVLPYAIVLGLTDKFARAMKDIGLKPTVSTWYYGSLPFNVSTFGGNIASFSNSFSGAIASAPKGSGFSGGGGGGFSGGGFGGGGGGSW